MFGASSELDSVMEFGFYRASTQHDYAERDTGVFVARCCYVTSAQQ